MRLCQADTLRHIAEVEGRALYILDDTWDDVPEDVDELSGHGAFITPAVLVCPEEQLPGALSLADPQTILAVPTRNSTVDLVLESQSILNDLVQRIETAGTNRLVTFYGDRPSISDLAAALGTRRGDHLNVWPPPGLFAMYNDKVAAKALWDRSGVNHPEHRIISDPREAIDLLQQWGSVFLKIEHSRSKHATDDTDCWNFFEAEPRRPVVAERAIDSVIASPILHGYSSSDNVTQLFVLNQLVSRDGHHFGNTTLDVSALPLNTIRSLCSKLNPIYPLWRGFFAFDFLVTSSNQVYVVDANFRINSSTLPFLWYYGQSGARFEAVTYLRVSASSPAVVQAVNTTELQSIWVSTVNESVRFVLLGGSEKDMRYFLDSVDITLKGEYGK